MKLYNLWDVSEVKVEDPSLKKVINLDARLNLALRYFVHGAYDKAFNKKATIVQALANEIIMASEGSSESFAVSKKNDAEKQADAAR
jgi:ribosomal protein S7